MWHMEWDRRRAYGRTAELIGANGVEADRLARRFQIERASQADWQILNDETHAMVEAYTAGVNAFLAQGGAPSVEFEVLGIRPAPWQPWDSLSIFKIRHVLMGVLYNKIWRLKVVLRVGAAKAAELYPGYAHGHPMIVPPDEIYHQRAELSPVFAEAADLLPGAGGSNNWVMDGTKTRSGKPLLSGDPHRQIDVPNVYYQNHLTCTDTQRGFDTIGVSFPGVPGFSHLGHNARVAWAITHAGADYQDLYVERFRPDDPSGSQYEYQGEWHAAEVSDERIQVRNGLEVVERVRRTRHGPIVFDAPWPHHAIALRYTAFEPGKTFECFLPMLRAGSVHELREAQREWVEPAQNLVMADVDGNIAYQTRGKLPLREEANGWLPVPGWSGAHEWRGFVPFEEMPRVDNPATHFIATANNRIVGDDYPYFISVDSAPGYRYARIAEQLRPLQDATADDCAAIQADRLSLAARALVPYLLALEPRDEPGRRALAALRAWDHRLEPDSVAATMYSTVRDLLMRERMEDLLGAELAREMFSGGRGAATHALRLRTYLPRFIEQNDPRLFRPASEPRGTAAEWRAALEQAFDAAVQQLCGLLGADVDGWQWYKLHHTAPAHPLSVLPEVGLQFDPPRAEYGGDGDTVQAAGYFPALGFQIQGTQCYRQIIDLGDLNRARWVVPLGASGHPGSPHYADQVEPWQQNRYVPMLFDWDEIEREAEGRLILSGA
jgi:penicillin amidase